MHDGQNYISQSWIERAKKIHNTADKFDLTALREGARKHKAEVDYILKKNILNPNTTFLDLACGNGRFCEAFENKVQTITGTDLCPDFIQHLNQWKQKNNFQHMTFFTMDLLEKNYLSFFKQSFSVIFLFGATQLIIEDASLLKILNNIKKILTEDGRLLIKQTTSLEKNDIHIDHFSKDIQQRWVAQYRTLEKMRALCEAAQLKVTTSQPIYTQENLGEAYDKVEKWPNTKQIIFDIVHLQK